MSEILFKPSPRDTVRETVKNETGATGSAVIIVTEKEIVFKARGLTVFQLIKIFSLFIFRKF